MSQPADVARFKTDGFSSIDPARTPGANPNANGYLSESVSAMLRHEFGERWDAGVRYFQSNGNDSFDNAFGVPTDLNNLYSKVRHTSAFVNGKLTGWWTTHFTVAEGDGRAIDKTNGIYNSRFDTDNRQCQYTWQNDVKIAPAQKVQLGYEHLDQSLDSDAFAAPARHVSSFFAGYAGRFGTSQIQANVRRDQYSDFGGANTYYLGYGLDFTEHWRGTASYSSAYRAELRRSLLPRQRQSVDQARAQPQGGGGAPVRVGFASRAAAHGVRDALYRPHQLRVDARRPLLPGRERRPREVQGLEGSWSGHLGKTDARVADGAKSCRRGHGHRSQPARGASRRSRRTARWADGASAASGSRARRATTAASSSAAMGS